MSLLNKKIRRECKRHGLRVRDLQNAVESLKLTYSGQHFDAQLFKDAVVNDSTDLWQVAHVLINFKED